MKICLQCGKEFKTEKRRQKYCSHECGYKGRKKITSVSHSGEMVHVKGDRYKIPYIRWNGLPGNKYFVKTICYACGKTMFQDKSNAKRHKRACCSKKCRSIAMSGANNHKWGGGEKLASSGHTLVYKPEHPESKKGFVRKHRFVMEKKLGRPLKKTELVHHINMVKTDNRAENLSLFSNQKEHFLCHGSLNECVEELIKKGVLRFDKETGRYSTGINQKEGS